MSDPINEPFTLLPLNEDGTRIMVVRGVEFIISKQSLNDEAWSEKLQAKANLFAKDIP